MTTATLATALLRCPQRGRNERLGRPGGAHDGAGYAHARLALRRSLPAEARRLPRAPATRAHDLRADLFAGLTVGIVALPLAMAFAIASGVTPQAGIFTAIIAGFLISLLGGSRVQIGGPTGAYIVIVYGIVVQYGVANLIVCTVAAGVLLLAMGLARLGGLIRFIPVSIVIGFTNGIAVLILLSQMKEFLGLDITMPDEFFTRMRTIAANIDKVEPVTVPLASRMPRRALALAEVDHDRRARRWKPRTMRDRLRGSDGAMRRCATARSSTPCAADACSS